ncbi:MAG: F0F1 ATP synthase subunit A [Verrucomicrobiales bacterium]|nr:F0F1 ATP synthase subunit A [Verrucomicrobiales bacterium]
MRLTKLILALALVLGWVSLSQAAEGTHAAATAVAHAAEGAHGDAHGDGGHAGLPPAALEVFNIGGLPVTNSMVVTWVVALLVILFARMATANMKQVPEGAQNFWEWLVESLHNFLSGIIGGELVSKTFWFFATVFIFILFTNWFGLIPGVGTVGWGSHSTGNLILPTFDHVERPLLRGGNADLNMTSAMSIVFFACWIVWALRANGPGGFISHIFGYRGDAKGGMRALLVAVFLAVGLLEVISIMFRPVSLSFRLYGNIFAGENLLEAMAVMGGKYFGWLVPLPFYGMELIVGLVQALVFTLLTAIFTSLICAHGDGHHEEHAHDHEHGPDCKHDHDHGHGHKNAAH